MLFAHTGKAHLVGITGSPGTGKSSLVAQLALALRQGARLAGWKAGWAECLLAAGALVLFIIYQAPNRTQVYYWRSGMFTYVAPMIGQGDYFQAQANYTQGALKYIFQNPNGNPYIQENQSSLAMGIVSDAVYGGSIFAGSATDLQLTTAWNVNASYEHFWNPRWRTSIHGGYAQVGPSCKSPDWDHPPLTAPRDAS